MQGVPRQEKQARSISIQNAFDPTARKEPPASTFIHTRRNSAEEFRAGESMISTPAFSPASPPNVELPSPFRRRPTKLTLSGSNLQMRLEYSEVQQTSPSLPDVNPRKALSSSLPEKSNIAQLLETEGKVKRMPSLSSFSPRSSVNSASHYAASLMSNYAGSPKQLQRNSSLPNPSVTSSPRSHPEGVSSCSTSPKSVDIEMLIGTGAAFFPSPTNSATPSPWPPSASSSPSNSAQPKPRPKEGFPPPMKSPVGSPIGLAPLKSGDGISPRTARLKALVMKPLPLRQCLLDLKCVWEKDQTQMEHLLLHHRFPQRKIRSKSKFLSRTTELSDHTSHRLGTILALSDPDSAIQGEVHCLWLLERQLDREGKTRFEVAVYLLDAERLTTTQVRVRISVLVGGSKHVWKGNAIRHAPGCPKSHSQHVQNGEGMWLEFDTADAAVVFEDLEDGTRGFDFQTVLRRVEGSKGPPL